MTSLRRLDRGDERQRDEWSYRSALCAYVIAETRHGVNRTDLIGMSFGGRSEAEESKHLERALQQLAQEGHVRLRGDTVHPGTDTLAGVSD